MEDLIWYLVSFVSYKVVVACLFSVPITHVIGVYLHCPKALRPWMYLLYPFTGGNRHVVFQLLGWALWAVSALAVLPVFISSMPVFLTKDLPKIPHTHVDVVSGAAAALSFMGEMFAIKALLVYDARGLKEPGSPKFGKPTSRAASAMVVVMGVLLTITGSLLLMALDYMPDIPSRVLYCCLSLSCLLTAASSTYGLGGFLRHVKGAGEDGGSPEGPARWQFFQPFAGGTVFVATQAVGWSLFSATIVLIAVLVQQLVAGVAGCVRCWAMGAGAMMMLAEVLLGVSLLTFRGKAAAQSLLRAASRATELRGLTTSWAAINMPVFLMYLPMHFFFTLWTLAFTFMPLRWALATWVGFLGVYYATTTAGYPAHTGVRRWVWLCGWFSRNLETSLASWFGSVRIINEGGDANKKRGAGGKYVFGFQPHGLYPTGAGFLPLMPSFLSCFPGVQPVTLVASVMFFPPFVRDIACWAGFRQVTRSTFVSTLNEAKAVILCPGGQAEMVHTHRAFKGSGGPFRSGPKGQREIVLHMRHKGFIKVAIEQGAAVVPVLALGETLQLRNFIDLPALQQSSYKRLGFPVPYLLVGRWGLAPLPMRVPLVYVVGEAIDPPQLAEDGVVTQAHVDTMHAQYVAAMKQLWSKHHKAHPEYVDAKLVLLTDEGTVSFSPEPCSSPEPPLLMDPAAEAAVTAS